MEPHLSCAPAPFCVIKCAPNCTPCRVVQGGQKSLCARDGYNIKLHVMFKVSPTSLQTFTDMPNCILEDARLTLMPSVISNSNYVITVSD
jgi:hypothetical protein